MRLSVIVASYNAPDALRGCLSALARQSCEVVVSDSSEIDPRPDLVARFPSVRWLRQPAPARALPELYWRALGAVSGDIVGLLEDRSIPVGSWAESILNTHRQDAAAAAVGGPVSLNRNAGAAESAYYFAEFARFAPPQPDNRCAVLSDANISFKRDFLEANREALDFEAWPSSVLRGPVRMAADAVIEYLCPNDLRASAAQRRRYGRGYAAARLATVGAWTRVARAARAAGLPALLLLRQATYAHRAGLSRDFARVLPRTLLLDVEWAVGEFLGYSIGPAADPQLH